MKVLLIEDEKELAKSIETYLVGNEFICEWVCTMDDAFEKIASYDYDCILLDLTLPDGTRTRYEVSRNSGRILYLNYEEKADGRAEPSKYRLYFKDFHIIQNTLVPYVTMVYQDDKLIEERKIVEAVFNVQLKDEAFKAENANKPAEAAAKQ